MISKIYSGTVVGLEGVLIEVEVDVANRGFPSFTIVGLPSKAIDEAKDRVRTAIVNSSFEMPESRITVNLAPADLPKSGASFDLPIAVGILVSSGCISIETITHSLFIGELSLEGKVREVSGIISIAARAKKEGIQDLYIPRNNIEEASLIEGITIYPVDFITDVVLHLTGQSLITPYIRTYAIEELDQSYEFDFADIKGQEYAKRALIIAAAGGHNVHLKGSPGVGKTMLCRALPSIMPPLDENEFLEVSQIYSAAGMMSQRKYIYSVPFRSPHHTTSRIGLIGGGTHPTPGEITLAHSGVLFLDELPEFPHSVLESLRQPLEDGVITISRATQALTFPSRFLFLSASNPCPCGYFGHSQRKCTCPLSLIEKYQKKVSGPLMDRIDMHVVLVSVDNNSLINSKIGEPSSEIRKKIIEVRFRQKKRFSRCIFKKNGQMRSKDIDKFCEVSSEGKELLHRATTMFSLSMRSYYKIIKVSQTIADLECCDRIEQVHIAEALQYRT